MKLFLVEELYTNKKPKFHVYRTEEAAERYLYNSRADMATIAIFEKGNGCDISINEYIQERKNTVVVFKYGLDN